MASTRTSVATMAPGLRTHGQRVLFGLMGAGVLTAGPAQALELSLHTRLDEARDGGMSWFTDSGTLSGIGFSASGVLLKSPRLSWTLAYDYSSADSSQYFSGYEADLYYPSCYEYYGYAEDCYTGGQVDGALTLHRLAPGLRLAVPVAPWLELFASAALEGVYGVATLNDSGQSWTIMDPADPEGEAVLYQTQPFKATGLGGGARAGVGATFWMNPGSGAARDAGGPSGQADASATAAPASASTSAPGVPWKVGLTLEGGYAFMLPVSFGQAGTLDLSGTWLDFGVVVAF